MNQPLPKTPFAVPYQVDFTIESKGRSLCSTKRKIIWKFGFAHPPTIFPHLYDENDDLLNPNDGVVGDYFNELPKKGIECRGREHEIVLTWSLLTGKSHIYIDCKEVFRHEPVDNLLGQEVFNIFNAKFHRQFNLPDPEHNGKHRLSIQCYAMTPMGAKNQIVNDHGGTFHQYDLCVDGLSFFSMPKMYELGTDIMWENISRWGVIDPGHWSGGEHDEMQFAQIGGVHNSRGGGDYDSWENPSSSRGGNGEFKRMGRLEDEHYFSKAKNRSSMESYNGGFGKSISKEEYKAMNPTTESDEERMVRIAMEASLKEWENNKALPSRRQNFDAVRSEPKFAMRGGTTNKLTSISEDNLIDFGESPKSFVSQVNLDRPTDVSVMDDDATTMSFVENTAWNSNAATHMYTAQQQYAYQDPTFRPPQHPYGQQPWSSAGTVSSTPITPGTPMPTSDMSFAVPPPPTWDEYNNAFTGGSVTSMIPPGATSVAGYTVMTNNQHMSPMSTNSVGMFSPMAQQHQRQQQYSMQQQGALQMETRRRSATMFDPIRANNFAT